MRLRGSGTARSVVCYKFLNISTGNCRYGKDGILTGCAGGNYSKAQPCTLIFCILDLIDQIKGFFFA